MSNDFLYVGTNIYHYAQMRSITFSTDHNIFFTIDPFYVLDPAKTIKDIQYIDPQAHYIPWKDISNRSWDIVFSSSNFINAEVLDKYQVLHRWKHILVEDGTYDYNKRGYKERYKSCCDLFLTYPIKGYAIDEYASVHRLPNVSDQFLTMMYKLYAGSLKSLSSLSDNTPVLYTAPLAHDYQIGTEEKIEKVIDHLNFSQIILKKHPRDDSHYRFYSTKIIECDPLLPGQILFRHFHGDHLLMFPSTICLSEISSKLCVKCDESKKKIFFFQNKNIINPSYLQVFDTVQNIGANIVII